jgi:primosomal protein N' (replication factor Y)
MIKSLQEGGASSTGFTGQVLQVVVDSPLPSVFDYLPPRGGPEKIPAGVRVRVPFGARRVVGLVTAQATQSELPRERLRRISEVLDTEPVLDHGLLELLSWAADYYQHPLGEVLFAALPVLLRQGAPARVEGLKRYYATAAATEEASAQALRRAPRQAAVLARLVAEPRGISTEQFAGDAASRRALSALVERGLVRAESEPCLPRPTGTPQPSPALNAAQQRAVETVLAALGGFRSYLLEGITGSGKTEVYLGLIERVLATGRQSLVLVPEIGLTPQLVERFRRRFACPIAVLHSGLNDSERLCAWLSARAGEAPIVIGTRSALFTPLPSLGLVVVDEEHDLSLKQQEGFRYHARDLAVLRAQREGVPIVLGSATPSLESLQNARKGNYELLMLPERAGGAEPPRLELLDLRHRPLDAGLSEALLGAVERHLSQEGQVLLFLNRRGYAPTLLCHDCGWIARCDRCDAHMTFHAVAGRLRCHHCGAERASPHTCPDCGGTELIRLGQGTERLEEVLSRRFPAERVLRIDRDTTRRRGAVEARLEAARSGEHRILVGTQMLAKGHDFPGLTLVGIIDIDQGLFSADFRAPERMAQLIVQVAGRAGRASRAGEVLIQTHHPEHPLLNALVLQGYPAFAQAALGEREAAGLPPFAHLALLRAEATRPEEPAAFLRAARELFEAGAGAQVELLGPAPAPMELRAGRYRAQLLLSATERRALHQCLRAGVAQLPALKGARRVRWSLDVDPQEMF